MKGTAVKANFVRLPAFVFVMTIIASLCCTSLYAVVPQAFKPLSLQAALEQGLRENYSQKQRVFSKEILNYQWFDTRESFWIPNLSLSLSTDDQRVSRLKRGSLDDPGNSRGASGTLSLGFSEYTLFNWGKDYLDYLSDRESYLRSIKRLSEEKRSLRHQIIIKYFELDYLKKVVSIRKRQLRHTSFVYRYSREKVSLKKIGKQDYYQSRSEYLRAQNQHRESVVDLKNAEEQMAFLISDQPGTRYIIKNTLSFIPLTTPLDDAIKLARENNPDILESTKDRNNAKRAYHRLELDNLPLPKLSVDLGSYTQSFNRTTNTTRFQTNNSGNHIDLVASVNATWALTGRGGLFNRRSLGIGKLNQQTAKTQLNQARHQTLSDIRRHYYKIKNFEDQAKILDVRSDNNSKVFELALDNYLARKTAYINFQDTLLEMVDTDITKAGLKYLHAREKINLAYEVGMDEFPGESFEQLASQEIR